MVAVHGTLCTIPLRNINTNSNYPTPNSRILLEKLIVAQLVNKFPHFMASEGTLLCSQKPITGPYRETTE
jgi:hypothetical protein